jgi:hypothetical protein
MAVSKDAIDHVLAFVFAETNGNPGEKPRPWRDPYVPV